MAGSRSKTTRKSGGRRKRPASKGSSSIWVWGAALVIVAGGIAAYDNSASLRRFASTVMDNKPHSAAPRQLAAKPSPQRTEGSRTAGRPAPVPQRPVGAKESETKRSPLHQRHDGMQTAAITPPAPIGRPVAPQQPAVTPAAVKPDMPTISGASHQTKFFLCGTAKQDDCVLAADAFMLKGQKIRIAGIEVPDIKKPRCEAERIKASDAKLRVRAFLDSGPFDLLLANAGDEDSKGQKIRAVSRNGITLSDVLVREGLAKRPGVGGGWC